MKITRRQMELLANSARDEKVAFVATLTPIDALRWDAHFESSAHKSQRPPPAEGWRIGLMMAGRGFGKTRAGAEWIEQLARSRPGVRLALVGASIEEARRIMVEGVSGVMSVAKRNRSRVRWEPSIGRLIWSNGSEAQLFSGDSPDGMRGPEHDFAWCGELAKWRYREAAWDNLQMLDTIVAAAVEEPPRNDPPATPITGNCFIVGIAPSGAWTGRASALAAFSAAGWRFVAPTEGLQAWVKSSSTWAVYQGGAWEVGAVRASRLMTGGVQVVGLQSGAIADAAGGTTVDAQARATIGEILTALRVHGLIASA